MIHRILYTGFFTLLLLAQWYCLIRAFFEEYDRDWFFALFALLLSLIGFFVFCFLSYFDKAGLRENRPTMVTYLVLGSPLSMVLVFIAIARTLHWLRH